jgi:hypothetical protein
MYYIYVKQVTDSWKQSIAKDSKHIKLKDHHVTNFSYMIWIELQR